MKYNLDRFLDAQKYSYQTALSEIKNGYKRSHWMWYIFPQLKGLGYSSTSVYYGVESIEEAQAYLNHPVLCDHLLEICEALLLHKDKSSSEILGPVDAKKLQSCMTLFHLAQPELTICQQILDVFYQGNFDKMTLQLIEQNKNTH